MEDNHETTAGQSIQSVTRAIRIIEALENLNGARVAELARHLDFAESTTHVYLSTLREEGYVRKDEDSNKYHITLRFLEVGCTIRQHMNIYAASKPELNKLSNTTGEVASLGCEQNGFRVVVYHTEGQNAVYDNIPTGQHALMHSSSIGKAILAHFSELRVIEIIEEHGLPQHTPQTITEKEELLTELENTRERGYALEDEERQERIRSVAVPLVTDQGVIGAISLAGPRQRFSDSYIEDSILPPLLDTVDVIQLQYSHYR